MDFVGLRFQDCLEVFRFGALGSLKVVRIIMFGWHRFTQLEPLQGLTKSVLKL